MCGHWLYIFWGGKRNFYEKLEKLEMECIIDNINFVSMIIKLQGNMKSFPYDLSIFVHNFKDKVL